MCARRTWGSRYTTSTNRAPAAYASRASAAASGACSGPADTASVSPPSEVDANADDEARVGLEPAVRGRQEDDALSRCGNLIAQRCRPCRPCLRRTRIAIGTRGQLVLRARRRLGQELRQRTTSGFSGRPHGAARDAVFVCPRAVRASPRAGPAVAAPQARAVSIEPCTSTTSRLPARRCRRSMFWVITPVEQPAPLELGQRLVRAVGPLVARAREARPVEGPEARRVALEDVDVGDLHRVDVLPQPRPGRAEVGDPGRHRDPRAGQRDRRTAPRGSAPRAARRRRSVAVATSAPFGVRLPRKAEMPSLASSLPKAVAKPCFSASMPSSRSPLCETTLICSRASGAWPASLRRPHQRRLEQLVVGDDAVDKAELERLVGEDRVADQVHLQRLVLADQARQALGAAEAGDDAELDLGLAEDAPPRRRSARRRPSPARSRRRRRGS